jgi:hypothetical protein
MERSQFFFQVTKEEEVTWSKVWAMVRMGQTLSFRGLNTVLRLLGIVGRCIVKTDKK